MAKGKSKSSGSGLSGSVTHLLHRALQLALDFHAEAAGPGALTQRQYTVLTATAAREGLTQNDLVRATGIDRSTLADLVARMLAKGLLVRDRSTTDARANWVRLSAAGQLALASGAGPAAGADDRLLARLSPKKRAAFIKTLSVLAAAADAPDQAKAAKGADKRAAKQAKSTKPAKAARAIAVKPAKKAKKAKVKKARGSGPA
jgi:DNA-binding MarR family transcriptional regulator